MKLKPGVAKGRDLPLRRENHLRILNRIFDIVLFQFKAGGYDGKNRFASGCRGYIEPNIDSDIDPSLKLFLLHQRDEFLVIFRLHLLQRNETKRG